MYIVIPFGLKNAPAFYIAMVQMLCEDWLLLFAEIKSTIPISNLSSTLMYDDKINIDKISLYFNHIPTLLHYFLVSYKFYEV